MPEILRLMIKYRNPCIISTKSDLILRDYDLIVRLSEVAAVNLAATITCMDERVRTRLEPGGVPSARRFEVLRAFSETRACTGVHLMPIIPFLTDSRANLSRGTHGQSQLFAARAAEPAWKNTQRLYGFSPAGLPPV